MKFFSYAFFLFLLSSLLFSQSPTGTITGRVINKFNQSGVIGATVRVLGTEKGAITNEDGKFIIKNVPTGIYQVRVSSIGFKTYIQSDVDVNSARPIVLQIELTESTIELEAAEVSASYFSKSIEASTSTQSLSFDEIRRAPGVQEDVLRATALLPGVNVTAAGRNDLIVRGGAPFENLFVVDNIEVPNINHFGSQGSTGGPLSIVNLDFVRNVEFSAGGFPATYGDKTSSLTKITLRNGNEEEFGGILNLSATQFGLSTEGPVGDNGSFLFSVRRSYLDLLFELAGFSFIPQFWDFTGKMDYRLDSKNQLSFLTIAAINSVTLNNEDEDQAYDNSQVTVPNQWQYFTGITWKHLFEKGFATVTLGRSFTDFETFQNDTNLVEIYRNDSQEGEVSLQTNLTLQIANNGELTVGNMFKYGSQLEYDILIPGYLRVDDEGNEQPLEISRTFNTVKNATYATYSQTIGKSKLSGGLRLNYYDFTKEALYLAPRFSYTFALNEKHSFSASAGRYFQSPSYIWLLGESEGDLSPVRADQVVLNYSHNPRPDLLVQFEVYYKWYENYPARVWRPNAVLAPSGFADATSDIPFGLEPLINDASGFARGIEFFVQKRFSEIPLYGLFSLTISESYFTSLDGVERRGSFDSPIIINLAAGYRFNSNWEASFKFRGAAGVPTTPYNEDGTLDFSQFNEGERFPFFHAVDVRVDRRWNFMKYGLILYVDIQNIYNNANITSERWDPREQRVVRNESIGLLPTIGVNFEF